MALEEKFNLEGKSSAQLGFEGHWLDAVWDVVRDVTRVGEWSHECVSVAWLDGAMAATPGARFRGRNKQGVFRWGRVCEIVTAKPYELVWRTASTAVFPDSTEWTIRLQRTGRSTEIEQSFRVVRGPKLLALAYGCLLPGSPLAHRSMVEDLKRLGALAVRSNSAVEPVQDVPVARPAESTAPR